MIQTTGNETRNCRAPLQTSTHSETAAGFACVRQKMRKKLVYVLYRLSMVFLKAEAGGEVGVSGGVDV